jgi:hypothetical protein
MKYLKSTLLLYLLKSNNVAVSSLRPSDGCNRVPAEDNLGYGIGHGESMDFTREIPGTQAMTHCLTLPTNYNLSEPSFSYFTIFGRDTSILIV